MKRKTVNHPDTPPADLTVPQALRFLSLVMIDDRRMRSDIMEWVSEQAKALPRPDDDEPPEIDPVSDLLLAIDNQSMAAKDMGRELFKVLPVHLREAFLEGFKP